MHFLILFIFTFVFVVIRVVSHTCIDQSAEFDDCIKFTTGDGLELPLTTTTLRALNLEIEDFPKSLLTLDKNRILYTYHQLATNLLYWRMRRSYLMPDVMDVTYGNHTAAEKLSHYNSFYATTQAFLNIVSILVRLTFIGFIAFCGYRFFTIVIKKYNVKNVPNYRTNLIKFATLNPNQCKDKKRLLLQDFYTVWRYLQADSGLSLKDPIFGRAFGNLFEFYLPESGQSIQEAFPLDFAKDRQLNETTWLKEVLEGATPSYRLMILSADERKLLKEAEKKKADEAATAAAAGATTQ